MDEDRLTQVFFKVEVGQTETKIHPPRPTTNFLGRVEIVDEGVDKASPLGTVHSSRELRDGFPVNCSTFVESRSSLEKMAPGSCANLPEDEEWILVTLESVPRDGDPMSSSEHEVESYRGWRKSSRWQIAGPLKTCSSRVTSTYQRGESP
jgi:hypothetical protein